MSLGSVKSYWQPLYHIISIGWSVIHACFCRRDSKRARFRHCWLTHSIWFDGNLQRTAAVHFIECFLIITDRENVGNLEDRSLKTARLWQDFTGHTYHAFHLHLSTFEIRNSTRKTVSLREGGDNLFIVSVACSIDSHLTFAYPNLVLKYHPRRPVDHGVVCIQAINQECTPFPHVVDAVVDYLFRSRRFNLKHHRPSPV
jgi:hypothetical protein